jgi:protocatechuate 3,4-dioxygenase beta subunit
MQRSLVLALILLLGGLLVAAWLALRDPTLPNPGPHADAPLTAAPGPAAATVDGGEAGGAHAVREAVANHGAEFLDDPEIRAGLCGFKGRVVTHTKTPVADCGVRMYRGALDSILPSDVDVFAPESTYTPNYIAGETKTDADGTWQITGVWPRAFYLMFAGIGTDAPMHQLITRTPSPGEIIDLGDIVLPNAGVIVGTVLDDNGDSLAGALVRAADLPGTLAAFFPVERFDPEGAVLVREGEFPLKVVVMPPWVKQIFENLPIPTTRSDGEGRFRLVGVVPGSNLLATTAKDFLSDMKASVQVRAGQEKDVGKIRLKRGEDLAGKVIDSAGKPVADAEVLAGSTIVIAPVDLAQPLGRSDSEGRFHGQGFAPGKVTVAARRGRGHAWVLADPQSILGEVVVTLPATFAIDATVTLADGKPAVAARLELLTGRVGRGAAEMHLMGLSPAIDLRDRKKDVAEGRWRIENLAAGWYTLIADAPGHATSFANVELGASDATAAIRLTAPNVFAVQVLDPENKPVRNAAIYAEARGGTRVIEMPVMCGRTAADGKLAIEKLQGDMLRVSADHPKWGAVHGEVKVGEELVLHMQAPGALHGVIRENGKPPEPARFSIALERRGDSVRGPLESVPALLSPGLDGTFAAKALQPGSYTVHAVKALDALRSPGGIFAMAQEAWMSRDLPREEVSVVSGQTTEVALEAGEKPLEGPTARLSGSVTIDGKLGAGSVVTANNKDRRFTARVDERGRFDFAALPAGDCWLQLMAATDGVFLGPDNNLWSGSLTLAEAENKEFAIEVLTASVSGVCIDETGAPAPGLYVQAQGTPKGSNGRGNVWLSTTTNPQGEFTFARIAEGKWTFSVRGSGGRRGAQRGQTDAIEVAGGLPVTGVRIAVQPATVVKGRIELASLGGKKPNWIWMSCNRLAESDANDAEGTWATGIGVDKDNGNFTTSELGPGRYRFRLHMQITDNENAEYPLDTVIVPAGGLSDLVLRPGPRMQR